MQSSLIEVTETSWSMISSLLAQTSYHMVYAMMAAVIGVVWSHLLTQPMELFEFWPNWVEKVFPYKRFEKVHKVMYQCEKCVAGQIALWFSVWDIYRFNFSPTVIHVMFDFAAICSAILFAYIIVLIIKRIE